MTSRDGASGFIATHDRSARLPEAAGIFINTTRGKPEMNKIRDYIVNNPLNWREDENYLS